MRAYVDADVLIWHLRGMATARGFIAGLRANPAYELWVGAMQRAEITFFMRTGEEAATLALFSQFKTAPVEQATVDAAGEIYRRWNPSHGTGVNDAILAATVRATGGKLYCLNTRHFPMDDIVVEQAWTPNPDPSAREA